MLYIFHKVTKLTYLMSWILTHWHPHHNSNNIFYSSTLLLQSPHKCHIFQVVDNDTLTSIWEFNWHSLIMPIYNNLHIHVAYSTCNQQCSIWWIVNLWSNKFEDLFNWYLSNVFIFVASCRLVEVTNKEAFHMTTKIKWIQAYWFWECHVCQYHHPYFEMWGNDTFIMWLNL